MLSKCCSQSENNRLGRKERGDTWTLVSEASVFYLQISVDGFKLPNHASLPSTGQAEAKRLHNAAYIPQIHLSRRVFRIKKTTMMSSIFSANVTLVMSISVSNGLFQSRQRAEWRGFSLGRLVGTNEFRIKQQPLSRLGCVVKELMREELRGGRWQTTW